MDKKRQYENEMFIVFGLKYEKIKVLVVVRVVDYFLFIRLDCLNYFIYS